MPRKNNTSHPFSKIPAFERMCILRNQKDKHLGVISKKEKTIKKINEKMTNYLPQVCREVTDELLSRDLGLTDQELRFLTILIRNGKSKTKVRLLQELIRRQLQSMYFIYINEHTSVSLKQIHKAIGEETNRRIFLTELNKKFQGILIFHIQTFSGNDTKDSVRAISAQLVI